MNPLVSIITVYYNREQYLKDSLDSLLEQTYENIEIIIVDDGSLDGTLETLKKYSDSRLRIVTHENMGFVKSVKKAVDLAKGEFIAIHGSGDISHKNRIERQVEVLKNNSDVGVVSNYAYKMKLDSIEKEVVKRNFKSSNYIEELVEKSIIIHGSAMFRKNIYHKVGGYREFFKFGQDRDLWLRMCQVSRPIVIPEVLYTMYILPGSVSHDFEKSSMQLFFQSISNQCVEQRLKTNTDVVFKYGYYAAFYRNRDRALAIKFARVSVVELSRNNYENAILALEYSKNEKNILLFNMILSILKIGRRNKSIKRIAILTAKLLRKRRLY